jgi:hypothetical protein
MQVNSRQKAILVGILVDVQTLSRRRLPPPGIQMDWDERQERQSIEDARHGVVRSEPGRWLGVVLGPSDYVMLSRDYKQLESNGLIVRHRFGFSSGRYTHIELTKSGKKLATELSKPKPKPAAKATARKETS